MKARISKERGATVINSGINTWHLPELAECWMRASFEGEFWLCWSQIADITFLFSELSNGTGAPALETMLIAIKTFRISNCMISKYIRTLIKLIHEFSGTARRGDWGRNRIERSFISCIFLRLFTHFNSHFATNLFITLNSKELKLN